MKRVPFSVLRGFSGNPNPKKRKKGLPPVLENKASLQGVMISVCLAYTAQFSLLAQGISLTRSHTTYNHTALAVAEALLTHVMLLQVASPGPKTQGLCKPLLLNPEP